MFENEEDTPGWKVGKSVAYCESCFNEMMERESSRHIMTKSQDDEAFCEEDITSRESPSSIDSADEKTKRYLLSKYLRSRWFAF